MCKATKDGGKRCGAHANVTLAAEMQISKSTGASIKTVKNILSALRKRGKDELAPSQEEVMEYAEQQKFIVNNDANLSAHDKKILSNRWNKAATEEVSGGTWYAIKRGLFAVLSFMKKRAVATGIIGVMTFSSVAACSGGVTPEPTTAPPTSITAPATPTPAETPVETPTQGLSVDGTANITVGETVGEGLNKRKELIAGDMSGLMEGVTIPEELLSKYTPEQLKTAQQTAAESVIEDIVDSDYLHSESPKEIGEWYNDIKPKVVEPLLSQLPTARDQALDSKVYPIPSNVGGWRGSPDAERPTATGAYYDKVSMKILSIEAVESDGNFYPAFVYSVIAKRPVLNVDKTDKKKYDEFNEITSSVSVDYSDLTKIVGFSNVINTKTVDMGAKQPSF